MKKPAILNKAIGWSATRFLRRIHRMTHRMPLRTETITKQRVLVMAPHSDDEVIGVGGCLALHQRAGSDVLVAIVTSDSTAAPGTTAARRMIEAEAVADLLGFRATFLEYPDGAVSRHEDRLAEDIARLLREHQPDVVFAPFPSDHHRDHQAVAAATSLGLDRAGYGREVWLYELWSTMWPNVAVDITDVTEKKRTAIELYVSQVHDMPYADAALGLNRYRGLRARLPYAEGIYACSSDGFRTLCKTLGQV